MKLTTGLSLALLSLSLSLTACGGDDAGNDDRKVVDLTAAEAMAICQELAADAPERTVMCGNGVTITVGTAPADCAMPVSLPATCTVTVSQVRACQLAQVAQTDAEICAFDLPTECAPLFACGE